MHSKYLLASLKKLIIINKMINPIGKAAMIATDCKLYIEFLANINAIGNKIKEE